MVQVEKETFGPGSVQKPDVYHVDQVGEFTYGPDHPRESINGGRKYYKHCATCMEQLAFHHEKGHEQFAPHHEWSSFCQSGQYPHCSCDRCF